MIGGFVIGELILSLSDDDIVDDDVGGFINNDFFNDGILRKPLFIGPGAFVELFGRPGPLFGFGGSSLCNSIIKSEH
jgi:hypothetical protein